jgi:uncharacterized damage-inducible protein DinB
MLAAHFRSMLDYEVWANARAIDSLESIPPDRRSGPAFDRAMRLIPHICLARGVWLSRLTATPHTMPGEWFPFEETSRQRALCAEVDARWAPYLSGLTAEGLPRACVYTSSEGTRYSSTVHNILSHVFNHSTYHRGQVARLVTECGGTRASTDLIAIRRTAL